MKQLIILLCCCLCSALLQAQVCTDSLYPSAKGTLNRIPGLLQQMADTRLIGPTAPEPEMPCKDGQLTHNDLEFLNGNFETRSFLTTVQLYHKYYRITTASDSAAGMGIYQVCFPEERIARAVYDKGRQRKYKNFKLKVLSVYDLLLDGKNLFILYTEQPFVLDIHRLTDGLRKP